MHRAHVASATLASASRGRSVRRAALLGLALLAAGCHALPELDWNPLVRIEHTADGGVEIEALGPLIDVRSGPEGVSHALRPLYQHKANFGHSVTDFLAPLGRVFNTRSGSRFRFWPLIWSGETRNSLYGTEWDGLFFPILFAGNGPGPGDGYFAFWPLGGRFRNLFGLETYDFFLWPFFGRMRMDITEQSTSWTVLLLFGWTTGGQRDGSWRALPFYRHRLVHGPDGDLRTDLHTVLWPFFTWGTDHGDTSSPSTRWGVWPLLSRETSERWYRTTVLWPFFRFNRQTDPPVKDGGDFHYDLPWPIAHSSGGQDGRSLWIFPFYMHNVTKAMDSRAFSPLVWWRIHQGRTTDEGHPPRDFLRKDLHVVPFWHHSTRTVDGRIGVDRQWQAWPLFHSDATTRGRLDAAFPSLMPVRHFEFLRPMEELYGPFWTLWRRRTDEHGQDETRLLLDTFLWRREPDGTRVSIPLLYAQRPTEAGGMARQVLWGLVGWRHDTDGLSAVSLLGVDLWAR